MLGDFWSTQFSTQIGPAVPHPRYGDCLLIVKFTRRRPLAPRGTAPVILPMARSVIPTISHDLLDLGSMENSHIPQCPVIVLRQGGDGLLDLALAMPLCPPACDGAPDHGQPARVDQSVSVDLARHAASLVDGIRDPNAIRSTASSRSSTAISARAADETSEMDFRRLRQESSGGRRASTSLVIAVTALVAKPVQRSSVERQNLRGGTKTLTARSRPAAQSPASPPEANLLPLWKSPRSASIVRRECHAYRAAQRARPVQGYCDA